MINHIINVYAVVGFAVGGCSGKNLNRRPNVTHNDECKAGSYWIDGTSSDAVGQERNTTAGVDGLFALVAMEIAGR